MPLLFLVFSISTALFLFFSFQVSYLMNGGGKLKAEIRKLEKETVEPEATTLDYSFVDEINGRLIRLCQIGQAMIIRCQECYASGKNNCPYPTDQFCQSAKGADYNDPNIVWGFLPHATGNLRDIWDYNDPNCHISEEDPDRDLKSINCLPQYIRIKARKILSRDLADLNITYTRPTDKGSTDVCAVEGVITGW